MGRDRAVGTTGGISGVIDLRLDSGEFPTEYRSGDPFGTLNRSRHSESLPAY